jgi:Fe-S-cluster-containing dehydrogenase component
MSTMARADGHEAYGDEQQPRVGFFTDTSVCIGCKACEVACKEWNLVPRVDRPVVRQHR